MIARGPRVRWVAAGIGPAAAVAVCILLQIRQPAPVPPAPGALRPIGAKDRLLILAPREADKALAAERLIRRLLVAVPWGGDAAPGRRVCGIARDARFRRLFEHGPGTVHNLSPGNLRNGMMRARRRGVSRGA
ncbi:MAG: hypothetical protein GXY35_11700 [Chlamydiae bacterium]|nr:hypothetical protein [Chlamydiota bacterium]